MFGRGFESRYLHRNGCLTILVGQPTFYLIYWIPQVTRTSVCVQVVRLVNVCKRLLYLLGSHTHLSCRSVKIGACTLTLGVYIIVYFPLLVMVRLAAENSHGAVYLLHKDKANHLVGESHLAERYPAVGALIHRLGKAIRSAYYEHHITTCRHLLLQIIGKLYGAVLLTVFIQQNQVGCCPRST